MTLLSKIWRSNFLIKLRSWEYWPFGLVYAPVFIYWLWLSLRAKSLLYFTASNPSIENGGMLGESKKKILDLVPDKYKAKTLFLSPNVTTELLLKEMQLAGLTFPVICKPDIGERGVLVEKINNDNELSKYISEINQNFLLQEYLDLPIELGVFYYRMPDKPDGVVSSIVIKEMLTVKGDGKSTLKELILNNDRSKLQWEQLKVKFNQALSLVLKDGEQKQLVGIGNHCKGTKFLDGNYLINDELHHTFNKISKEIDGFYFGRYDIRVASTEDLYKGNIKIMELNGAGSEPAHIYNPGYSILKAYKSIFHHWKILFKISVVNRSKGVLYLPLKEGWKEYRKLKATQ